MSPEQAAADVIARFAAWSRARSLSQVRAARMINCSPATLSQLTSGTYAGNVERYVDAMRRELARADRRDRAPARPPIEPTSVLSLSLATLRAAHDDGTMVVIMGDSGAGKTVACREYLKAEPETIMVTLVPWDRNHKPPSIRATLLEIADALDLKVGANTPGVEIVKAIADALRGSGRLIIIDEIDYASEGFLQTFRALHDASGCGFALIATPAFLVNLKRRRSATINQILNRISQTCNVASLTDDDADMILAHYKLDSAARQAARCGAHGCTRRLINGMTRAQALAAAEGRALDAKTICDAFKSLLEV